MSRREQINEDILNQKENPFRGNKENTYLNDRVFKEFVQKRDLKLVYVTKLGLKYGWDELEIQQMYDKTPDSWFDGFKNEILFDFGLGENKIAREGKDEQWHQPHHDHIYPRTLAKRDGWSDKEINHPNNIQIIAKIQNEMKSWYTLAEWNAVAPTIEKIMVDNN